MAWISKPISVAQIILSSVLLVGCATHHPISNVPFSFNAVKTVVVSNLPAGVHRESQNGRTMTSGFFNPQTLKPETLKDKTHAYVVVTILGSSRPYDIDVHAFTEEKDQDGWAPVGEDAELTERLIERLRTALADRREDRNVIDDFRAF